MTLDNTSVNRQQRRQAKKLQKRRLTKPLRKIRNKLWFGDLEVTNYRKYNDSVHDYVNHKLNEIDDFEARQLEVTSQRSTPSGLIHQV